MSNAANRHAVAVAVNRVLRAEKLISVEMTQRSYKRLISLQMEFEHIDTASALLKLVRLRIAAKKGAKAEAEPTVAEMMAAPALNVFAVDQQETAKQRKNRLAREKRAAAKV